MNKFLYKLEKKIGKYAIKNLPLTLILCYITGYMLNMVNNNFLTYFTLNPSLILKGQIWRLITWIVIPPEQFDILTIIMLYFYYSIGTTLERVWGTFRYNFYIFSGIILTVIGSFVLYAIAPHIGTALFHGLSSYPENYNMLVSLLFSTYYINMSIFLAYAATFPNAQILFMFIIPIKVKILGIIYALFIFKDFYNSVFEVRFIIIVSLLNFLLFFLITRNYRSFSPKEIKRRNTFKRAVREGSGVVTPMRGKSVITRHKCAICNKTELDDESLEFRFCSKCEGNYEYCSDHLFTHEHVKKE